AGRGRRRGVRRRVHHRHDGAPAPAGRARGAAARARRARGGRGSGREGRGALLREQPARAEAERVAEMVGGMQALVDAALAHRTLEGILRDLVTQVRGVVPADTATIYLPDEGGRLTVGASSPRGGEVGHEFAIWVAESR